jgi:serine/arginine repetitive matrix protein 2
MDGDVPPIPPVPPLFYSRMPAHQARAIRRSAKGSFSSGSINMRTDSDAPSSDLPSPPTPREGSSLEVLLTRTESQVLIETIDGVSIREQASEGPDYYDYSEHFQHTKPTDFKAAPILPGSLQVTNTIREEQGPTTLVSKTVVEGDANAVLAALDIVELPASPVGKRITRDLVLGVLEAPSSTADSEASDGLQAEKTVVRYIHPILDMTSHNGDDMEDLAFNSPETPRAPDTNAEFETSVERGRRSLSSPGMAPSTEGDMSDLLSGYQHTDDRQQDGVSREDNVAADVAAPVANTRRNSGHAPKLSDEQSFKSCTDILEPRMPQLPPNTQDERSFKSPTDVLGNEELKTKASDDRSIRSRKDLPVSSRSASVPASSLPSIDRASDFHTPRPFSEMQLISHSRAVVRKPCALPFDPISNEVELRSGSRPSIKQRPQSDVASSTTLIVAQQPPVVPPRESSVSKEAQRSLAVGSWMLRSLRWGRRQSRIEEPIGLQDGQQVSRGPLHDLSQAVDSSSSPELANYPLETPEKALCRQDFGQMRQTPASSSHQSAASPNISNGEAGPSSHQSSSRDNAAAFVEASSMYSPQRSSLRSRVRSSPAGVPGSPVYSRPDSQTTTHLVWHGRNALAMPPTSASEPHLRLSNDREDTTTDLRLSQYRYNGPLHCLPDLKEESHEDSSLNTSASNLKHSSFRFPFGAPLGVRASVDDGIRFSRRSSVGGTLSSALAQAHGLPSMNFSRMNLLEKLNEEFGLHGSRSLDDFRPASLDQGDGSLQRPVSAGEAKGRRPSHATNHYQLAVTEGMLPVTATSGVVRVRRTQSPELLAEIDQLTIPSVGGLTQRISEFLPSLRNDYMPGGRVEFPAEQVIMEHAMEEIHEIGGPAQKRSSARLRPMPGSPDMVVVEDVLYANLIGKDKEGGGMGSQDDEEAHLEHCEGASPEGDNETVPHTQRHKETSLSKTRANGSSTVHIRSHTAENQVPRVTVESGLQHRRSLQSFASTPRATESQPWNSDKSYPWVITTIPSVDISLPPPSTTRPSPLPGPSHLRNRLSDASSASTLALNTPVSSPLENTSDTSAQACQLHRFSIFGANSDQSHAAGERYPTSALTPPTAIFRDHFSASDTSDDETEPPISRKGRFSLKKRFSSARKVTLEISTRAASKKKTAPSPSPLDIALPNSPVSATSIVEDRATEAQAFTATNRHTFRDAEGMPSATYHRYRLVEHLKRWWHKSGDLIRRLSTRS